MKSVGKLGLILALAALLALPVVARAEMYVEGYIGGVMGANAPMDVPTGVLATGGFRYGHEFEINHVAGRFDPAVVGGLKVGTWFVKEGFLGWDAYCDWMKYFGFYVDFSFHRLNFRNQSGGTIAFDGDEDLIAPRNNIFSSNGTAATLAFMFAGRYGFLPDSDVPFGRLQPYLAVGPAILFASQRPKITFQEAEDPDFSVAKMGSKSVAAICLAAEAGVRWMCLKNVSVDLSFKYRYAQPSFDYTVLDPRGDGVPDRATLNPTLHLFSGQLGVAYHF